MTPSGRLRKPQPREVGMKISVAKQKLDALKADLFVVPVAEGAETSGAVKELRPVEGTPRLVGD